MIDVSLSVSEISLLRHCIGYTAGLNLYDKTSYTAYRNYYCTPGLNPTWERLCKLGVCVRGERVKCPRCADNVYYHLTKAGAELLGNYLGVRIVLDD